MCGRNLREKSEMEGFALKTYDFDGEDYVRKDECETILQQLKTENENLYHEKAKYKNDKDYYMKRATDAEKALTENVAKLGFYQTEIEKLQTELDETKSNIYLNVDDIEFSVDDDGLKVCWFHDKEWVAKKVYDEQKKQIRHLKSNIGGLQQQAHYHRGKNIELSTPIEIAKELIEHQTVVDNNFLKVTAKGLEMKKKTFSISELRQISEHLLVYCNGNEDKQDE